MNTLVIDTFNQILTQKQNEDKSELIPMVPLFHEQAIVFCGIDNASESRYFFIEIPDGPWEDEQMKSLPKWHGLQIKMEHHDTFGPLNDRYFIEFIQADPDTGDLFETIMQNLFDHVITRDPDEPLFTVIYKVLEKWRSFFRRGGYKKLNEDQQRGLFGELWFMRKWIENNPDRPPLLLESWGGPLSDRVDFRTNGFGVEIKTVRDQINKRVRISNEKQLRITDAVPEIYLYVCYLEESRNIGHTLQDLVDELRIHFYLFSLQLRLKFDDLLRSSGFSDNEYTDLYLNVLEEETYTVDNRFPMIPVESLPKGISHVSYSIDLSHCEDSKIDSTNIFNLTGR
ncbi:PD-(D/E)XK motif protein [Jeotgalibacillus proteolyticus]|uniref:PD-(D/E)XK motif protein n=1 Tax=Jeotgalibacillus proteolyticus TaxID=2082395 RepID=UPI003CF457AC